MESIIETWEIQEQKQCLEKNYVQIKLKRFLIALSNAS